MQLLRDRDDEGWLTDDGDVCGLWFYYYTDSYVVLQDLEVQPNLWSAGHEREVDTLPIPVNFLADDAIPRLVGGIEDNVMVDGT